MNNIIKEKKVKPNEELNFKKTFWKVLSGQILKDGKVFFIKIIHLFWLFFGSILAIILFAILIANVTTNVSVNKPIHTSSFVLFIIIIVSSLLHWLWIIFYSFYTYKMNQKELDLKLN